MTRLDSAQLLRWRQLVCDPADSRFLTQLVSEPSEQCPQGSAVGDIVWDFPEEIAGSLTVSARRIRWDVAVADGCLTDSEFAPILTTCRTIALNMLRRPGRKRRILGTVKGEVALVIRLGVFLAERSRQPRCIRIVDLGPADARRFAQETVANCVVGGSGYDRLRGLLQRIQRFQREGQIGDGFTEEAFTAMIEALDCADADPEAWPDNGSPPYSNEFCLGLMEISDVYLGDLLDDILVHVRKMKEFWTEEDQLRRDGMGPKHWEKSSAPMRYAAFAAGYHWKVDRLDFPHDDYDFPPKTTGDLNSMVTTLQSTNLQVELLSTAGRDSEVLRMDQNSHSKLVLDDGEVDLLSAKRYKTSSGLAGYKIGWPVSPRAVRSFDAQVKLAQAAGSKHLWISTSRGYSDRLRSDTAAHLQKFAVRHRLDLGDEGRSYSKRFRPTVALLMTTGPEGHPHLAKRALGHKSLETTINYLRLNRHIQAEISYDLRRFGVATAKRAAARHGVQLEHVDLRRLAVVLEQQDDLNLRARLAAPGVVAFCDPDGDTDFSELESDASARSTLEYAVGALSDRRTRKYAGLFDWLASEVARIADERPQATTTLVCDSRARAMLAMARNMRSRVSAA